MKSAIVPKSAVAKKTLIIGAGVGGQRVIREIQARFRNKYHIVGILDDDPTKKGREILGVPVLGPIDEIKTVVKETGAEHAIIAIPSATGKELSRIVNLCEEAGIDYNIVPGVYDFISGRAVVSSPIRKVSFEDLIKRKPVHMDIEEIRSFISGKRVAITGGAGTIGSEIVRSIIELETELILVIDVNENSLMELLWEPKIRSGVKKGVVIPMIADIRNMRRMSRIFSEFNPHIVYHAAARKHVPLMELFPEEAVETNVIGTYNMLGISEESGVETFVLISTDKAVNPTNVMGATKRMAELLAKEYSLRGNVNSISVRFGNVLGSAGSVINLFRKQIERGGPVTVTDPEIKRFFMSISEAARLVIQCSAFRENGHTYVLEMGEQIKILDIAERMIKLAGFEPYEDIEIKFIGLRPGEKMYEELYYPYEEKKSTKHPYIFKVLSDRRWPNYIEDIKALRKYVDDMDIPAIINKIKEVVPEFKYDNTKFEKRVRCIV